MGFEVERSKVLVKIYGETYELSKPRVKQVKEIQEKVKEKDQSKAMVDLLELLGLPRKVTEDMELGHVTALFDFLGDSKKK